MGANLSKELNVEVKEHNIVVTPTKNVSKRGYIIKIQDDKDEEVHSRPLNQEPLTFEVQPSKTYQIIVRSEKDTLTPIKKVFTVEHSLKPKAKVYGAKIKYTWNDVENKEFEIKILEDDNLTQSSKLRNNSYVTEWKPGVKHDFKVRLVSDGYDDIWESASTVRKVDAGLKPKVKETGKKLKCTWTWDKDQKIELKIIEPGELDQVLTCSGNEYSFDWSASTEYKFEVRPASTSDDHKYKWESTDTFRTRSHEIAGVKLKQYNGIDIDWRSQGPNTKFDVKLQNKKERIIDENFDMKEAHYLHDAEGLCPGETYKYSISAKSFSIHQSPLFTDDFEYTGDLHVRYFFFRNEEKILVLYHVDGVKPEKMEARIKKLENDDFELLDQQQRTVRLKADMTPQTTLKCKGGPTIIKAIPEGHQIQYKDLQACHLMEKEFIMKDPSVEGKYILEHIIMPNEIASFEWDYKKTESRTIGVKIMLFRKKGQVAALLGKNSWDVDQTIAKYVKEGYKVLTLTPLKSNLYVSSESLIYLENGDVQVQPPRGHTFSPDLLHGNDPIPYTFTYPISYRLPQQTSNMNFIVKQRDNQKCVHPFQLLPNETSGYSSCDSEYESGISSLPDTSSKKWKKHSKRYEGEHGPVDGVGLCNFDMASTPRSPIKNHQSSSDARSFAN
ncbi:uncharacterized protein LOC144431432 [Styela clava]